MVCGIVFDGFSGWGGGITVSSDCLDAGGTVVVTVGADGCGGSFFESGDGGGGEGVGEWSRVIGLGEVRVSGGLSG